MRKHKANTRTRGGVLSVAAAWTTAALVVLAVSAPRPVRADAVVGTGIPASCTEAALDVALAGGGSITFNCGPGPHTIVFDTSISANTAATVDGGGQITLSGENSTTLFLIQSGAALTLTSLTVTKGFANADGGAVRVFNGGVLVEEDPYFLELVRYIHLNPVPARVPVSIDWLEQYPWTVTPCFSDTGDCRPRIPMPC